MTKWVKWTKLGSYLDQTLAKFGPNTAQTANFERTTQNFDSLYVFKNNHYRQCVCQVIDSKPVKNRAKLGSNLGQIRPEQPILKVETQDFDS